jgi:hypothetical protein
MSTRDGRTWARPSRPSPGCSDRTGWSAGRGFERGLAALTSLPAGRASLRLAVAIGRDANSEPLDRFRSRDAPVLVADTVDVIVDRLVAASIAVSRMSEVGADRGALAQQLLRPGVAPGSGLTDDSVL